MPEMMRAMVLDRLAPLGQNPRPLRLTELPVPEPARGDLLLEVRICGVCHTELDEIEGRLVPPRLPLVLGHEIVAVVAGRGPEASRFEVGDRVGVGWIHHSSGGPRENLSDQFRATGYHVNGGYAEFLTVPENYAVPMPPQLCDTDAAPLMCAGAIGFRALRLASLGEYGLGRDRPLGLMGFGGSAHLVLPTAKHLYPDAPVYVFDRSPEVQQFALTRCADWAGGIDDSPPAPPVAIIDTTPVWRCVVAALKHLAAGGRLVINAIRKENADQSELLQLSYHDHLWMEREIKTVANLTFQDIAEFLPLAAEIPLRPRVTCHPLEQANQALVELRGGAVRGAHALQIA